MKEAELQHMRRRLDLQMICENPPERGVTALPLSEQILYPMGIVDDQSLSWCSRATGVNVCDLKPSVVSITGAGEVGGLD